MITNEVLRYLGIAFASSVLLIVLSKVIMQFLFRRPADYYLKEEYRQEEIILNSAGFSITDEVETNPEGEVTDEHIHVEPQIPEAEDKPEPAIEPAAVTEEKPEPALAAEPAAIPKEKPEPAPAAAPMFEIPVSSTLAKPLAEQAPEPKEIPAGVPLKKNGEPRKPSMSMKKEELAAIAEWKGIDLPPDATKAIMLRLIESAE